MAYQWTTWLPAVLRSAGCQVVEHAGWQSRGLVGGVFEPAAVVWHHDASPPGDSPGVPAYLIANYQTASAQLWVDRAGVWHVIGAGRAPHAGAVLPGMPGNSTSIGVETDHTTGEPWPAAQLQSLRKGTAALLFRLGRDSRALHFHRTICSPPGRKSDPAGLDLETERAAVAGHTLPSTPPTTGGDDMPLNAADIQLIHETVVNILRAPEFQLSAPSVAGHVWGQDLGPKHGLGPAAAADWLMDARAAAGAPPAAVDAGAVALSDADVARIAKAVNDDAAARLKS